MTRVGVRDCSETLNVLQGANPSLQFSRPRHMKTGDGFARGPNSSDLEHIGLSIYKFIQVCLHVLVTDLGS